MPETPPSRRGSLHVRLLKSLAVLAACGLLFMAGHWALRVWFFPAPAPERGGLLAQRFQGARLAGEPGPAFFEKRTAMSDADDPDFRGENFSLRMTGHLRVKVPGPYRLAVESDDDSRLFLDGVKIIDNSGQHPMRLYEVVVWLGPGQHLYEVEYAQRDGGAGLRLLIAPPWGGLRLLKDSQLTPAAQPLTRETAEALGHRVRLACFPLAALLIWAAAMALVRLWWPGLGDWRHLALASLIMVLGMWANSGTLAPLAATQYKPHVWEGPGNCTYLGSIDEQHFEAAFWMLDGDPPRKWSFSLVLRRIIQPLFAYPFVKTWGFLEGGFLANLLIHLAMIVSWAAWLRRRAGARGGRWALHGLALYPGVYYWSSLPYSYAFVVPGSIWAFMALWELGLAATTRRMLLWCGVLGLLFLGYDIWPFFLPAAPLLILWRTRRLGPAAMSLPPLILPTAAMIAFLSLMGAYSAPIEQGHEPLAVFASFLGKIDLEAWWGLVKEAPLVLLQTYLFSNYLFLPLLFPLLLWVGGGRWGVRPAPAEACLAIAALAVFLFNNLAPPYPGWQFRGEMYVRFYQPLAPLLLFYLARVMQAAPPRSWLAWPVGAVLLLGAWVTFGPALNLPQSAYLHCRFGQDGDLGLLEKNLARHGRRPLGVCPPCQEAPMPARPAGG